MKRATRYDYAAAVAMRYQRSSREQKGWILDLTVVEIAAWLLEQDQEAGWITERELLRDELSAARDLDGRLRRGPGRRPDGCWSERTVERKQWKWS